MCYAFGTYWAWIWAYNMFETLCILYGELLMLTDKQHSNKPCKRNKGSLQVCKVINLRNGIITFYSGEETLLRSWDQAWLILIVCREDENNGFLFNNNWKFGNNKVGCICTEPNNWTKQKPNFTIWINNVVTVYW